MCGGLCPLGGAPNYFPNSFQGPVDDAKWLEHMDKHSNGQVLLKVLHKKPAYKEHAFGTFGYQKLIFLPQERDFTYKELVSYTFIFFPMSSL